MVEELLGLMAKSYYLASSWPFDQGFTRLMAEEPYGLFGPFGRRLLSMSFLVSLAGMFCCMLVAHLVMWMTTRTH